MTPQLFVYFRDRIVGLIVSDDRGQMGFAYDESWLAASTSFPISVSMPLQSALIDSTTSHNFFVNLLPEENVRIRICNALKISQGNDFELLKAIGGDCAGALTVTAEDRPRPLTDKYQELSDDQLASWSIGTPDAFSAITGQRGVRLSLAGAQDKLPVRVRGQHISVPQGNSPSTHLLKFASSFYSHLPENETFISFLARSIGLNVVTISLLQTKKARIAIVQRYDREFHDGVCSRIHQEDFCQALGVSPTRKYEKEGGPSLQQCCEIVKKYCTFPILEIKKLIDLAIFNLLVGNSDGHGKNISLLFTPNGSIALAPFYDLVCTRNYEQLDRNLAMAIGGESDPGQIGVKHFRAMANELDVAPSLVLETVETFSELLLAALPRSIEQFSNEAGESPMLERLPQLISKQIARTRTMI